MIKNYQKVEKMASVAGENLIDLLKCDPYGVYTYKDYLMVQAILKLASNVDLSDLDDALFDVQTEVKKKFK
jgi:hypothetical protein